MPQLRISEAAALLGVSDDTIRRWVQAGRLASTKGEGGRMVVDGRDLAELSRGLAEDAEGGDPGRIVNQSARNRLRGIVTRVTKDIVMAQVEMQAGPFRVVSLMSREAADELGLEPGVVAIAAVKATNVVVEITEPR